MTLRLIRKNRAMKAMMSRMVHLTNMMIVEGMQRSVAGCH